MICINKNSAEYQHLKEVSGISELSLDSICYEYLERFARFPRLDEINNSNSSKYLKNKLRLDSNNSTDIGEILKNTGENTLEDAIVKLNRQYNDLEISAIPIVNKAIVIIKQRPTDNYKNIEELHIPENKVNMSIIITKSLDKLAKLYGIKVNQVTDEDLNSEKYSEIINKDKLTKAFIYNGEIYINIDRWSPDSFVHEMLHLLVGSMRFTNPEIYNTLINQAETFQQYDLLLKDQKGKTRNDANEEIFVTQLARYLVGMPSQISKLSETQEYEINYNVHRILDSMLMGDYSTKIIDDNQLYKMTLKNVVQSVNSNIMTNIYMGELTKGSATHRKLNIMKQDLLQRGELIETCD